jgi:hypothetical protein
MLFKAGLITKQLKVWTTEKRLQAAANQKLLWFSA